jgi:hypothetical protein
MGEFLLSLYEPDDLLEIRFLPSKRRMFAKASELPGHIDRLRRESDQGQNVYISANPRLRRGGKTGDVALARSVFADLENIDPAAATERCYVAGLPPPTVLVSSGHGCHVYWVLTEPMTDLQAWSAIQKRLAALLGGDPKVFDPPRVMRLPGFLNHKPPPAQCYLCDAKPERRYRLEDLLQQSQQSETSNGGNREIEQTDAMIASVVSADSTGSAHSVDSVTLLHENALETEEVIRCTLPAKPGQRHKCIFEFARALKGISAIADLPAGDLKPVVRRWHKAALPFIKTQPFDDTWADFVAAWRNVQFPLGESPLDQIFAAIQSMQPPAECAEYDTPKVRLLVALCAELQRIKGDADFYLDCRAAGKLLDVDPVSAWRWLKMFKADGLLLEKETGRPGRCTRWRWRGRP